MLFPDCFQCVRREVGCNPYRTPAPRITVDHAPQRRHVVFNGGTRIALRQAHHPSDQCLQHYVPREPITVSDLRQQGGKDGIGSTLPAGRMSSSNRHTAKAGCRSNQQVAATGQPCTSSRHSRSSASTSVMGGLSQPGVVARVGRNTKGVAHLGAVLSAARVSEP